MNELTAHLDEFQLYLLETGFSASAAKNYRFRVATFLRARPDALRLDEGAARAEVEGYAAGLPRNTSRSVPAAAVRKWWSFRFSKPYRERLRPADCVGDDAIDAECSAFAAWLEGHGNVCASTRRKRVGAVRVFLYATYPGGGFERGRVTLEDVVDYHSRSSADRGPSLRRLQGSDLRSYCKFLRSEGVDVGPLDAVSLTGPSRRDHVVPGRLDETEYRLLLDSCKRDTPRGARDHAMALCMGNLGLRACDVARLTLDDVDWAGGTLAVRGSKSKTGRVLPLDAETGTALERWALAREARGGTRALFVDANGGPVTSGQVQTAMSLAAGRACIDSWRGTHGLRRMVATNMANAGVDVKSIADVLGHERIDTTAGYVRVGAENLRKVAARWPEGGGDE